MKTFSNRVRFAIASELCNSGEYAQAIQLLALVVHDYPDDIVLLSAIARIYLQMGNTTAANSLFDHVEQFIRQKYPGDDCDNDDKLKKQTLILLNTNRGYQALALGAFSQATTCFEKVLTYDKNNAMAVNNLSLGWLYSGHLQTAIKCLEDFINADMQLNLRHEVNIVNLCTLYDLACHDSTAKKRNLLVRVAPYLSDNFDLTAFKIPDLNVLSPPTL